MKIWILVKLSLLSWLAFEGHQLVSDFNDADETPPLWIALIVLTICIFMGLALRASSQTPAWKERELWLANPFRYVVRPFDKEAFYYPPFFHLGALGFIASGASAVVSAVYSQPKMIGDGLIIFAGGAGLWFGMRMRDIFKPQKP
jgi:hypothetical protein